jgi:tryptophanyl-tRNA synthetase
VFGIATNNIAEEVLRPIAETVASLRDSIRRAVREKNIQSVVKVIDKALGEARLQDRVSNITTAVATWADIVRRIAINGDAKALLRATDELRDDILPKHGIRLEDQGGRTVVKLDEATHKQLPPVKFKNDTHFQIITPYEVSAGPDGIDYNKITKDFGSTLIDDALLMRMERITGQPVHHWFRKGLFYSHRDLNLILDAYETAGTWANNQNDKPPFFLYTGRGPSSESMHMGHLIPFMMTRWLQKVFGVPLVIQMTDDEKCLFKTKLTVQQSYQYCFENVRDILALGFDPERTFIFSNLDYVGHMYRNIVSIQKMMNVNLVNKAFGFTIDSNIGQVAFPAIQATPSFSSSFPHMFGSSNLPCLIPCAIDQDPYFRITRDIAPRLGWHKPALVHSKFFPSLQGSFTKMSASMENSAIYLSDMAEQIKYKIHKHAFSGGRDTLAEHRKYGGNPDIDVSYQYLRFFVDDNTRLEQLHSGYRAGTITSGEMKTHLVKRLQEIISEHQHVRATITDDMIRHVMSVRKDMLLGPK